RRRISGHAARAQDRPRFGADQLSVLVARDEHRDERCVPGEHEGSRPNSTGGPLITKERHSMFISKKHIPRRAILRGAGVGLALPLLDAMIPAATLLAQTAAAPKPRFFGGFVCHGGAPG